MKTAMGTIHLEDEKGFIKVVHVKYLLSDVEYDKLAGVRYLDTAEIRIGV